MLDQQLRNWEKKASEGPPVDDKEKEEELYRACDLANAASGLAETVHCSGWRGHPVCSHPSVGKGLLSSFSSYSHLVIGHSTDCEDSCGLPPFISVPFSHASKCGNIGLSVICS